MKKKYPEQPITPERFSELRSVTWRSRVAFDETRAMFRLEAPDVRDFSVFDGRKNYRRTKYSGNDHESITIRPTVGRTFEHAFTLMTWLRAAEHRFWCDPLPRESPDGQEIVSTWEKLWPESAVRGPVYYRDQWCWVVIFRHQRRQRWYVGMDDHRLYGMIDGFVGEDSDPRFTVPYVRAAAARGATVTTEKAFWAWQKTWGELIPQEQKQLEYERLMGDVNINLDLIDAPFHGEQWLADYREVAPGCWLPFKQGIVSHTTEKGVTVGKGEQEVFVSNVRVNEPLPDAWFEFSFADAEGAQVFDQTFTPPLIYKWKKDHTSAEWQTVFDEAKRRQADEDARQAALNKVVGRPAPAFGNGEWINGPPRTWADFKGKVVLVDFWAEWCGPCMNDLPALTRLAADPAAGIAVVGVHTAGSRRGKIDAHLQQFGITYPVYVDQGDGGGFGALMNAFGVRALPQTFVLDTAGRVAAQGPLGETLPVARTLARQAATRPTTRRVFDGGFQPPMGHG